MNDRTDNTATRRTILRAGVAIAASGAAVGLAARRAVAQEKIAKNLVNYQDQPNNGQHCAICAQFMPPNACKVVDGEINPNGWCAAFAPKDS